MRILSRRGVAEVASVFVGDLGGGRTVEFVESTQPPLTRDEKWVLIVSVLHGCPVGCLMCDAGVAFAGPLTAAEIYAQIDFLIRRRYANGEVPVPNFKIQFARMGEPAMNPAVLEVLRGIHGRYRLRSFVPSLSTVAPRGCERFFDELLDVRSALPDGERFQLQFSVHSTDPVQRDRLVPIPKWGFDEMASYGERFLDGRGKRVALNFALARGVPLEASTLLRHFDPSSFLVKVTPLNPTYRARESGLVSYIDPRRRSERDPVVEELEDAGYRVIVSVGDLAENRIGSNCGQYVRRHLERVLAGAPRHPSGYVDWEPDG